MYLFLLVYEFYFFYEKKKSVVKLLIVRLLVYGKEGFIL